MTEFINTLDVNCEAVQGPVPNNGIVTGYETYVEVRGWDGEKYSSISIDLSDDALEDYDSCEAALADFCKVIRGKLPLDNFDNVIKEIEKIIGDRFPLSCKELRRRYDLSQQKFSDILNIPKRTIGNWECEVSTPPEYVLQLIEFKLRYAFPGVRNQQRFFL